MLMNIIRKCGRWGLNENSKLHPCLSHDGTRLYFASDMKNGFGGSDIYFHGKLYIGTTNSRGVRGNCMEVWDGNKIGLVGQEIYKGDKDIFNLSSSIISLVVYH